MVYALVGIGQCVFDQAWDLIARNELKEPGVVCELGVADVARSISFYEKLGFETIEVEPVDGSVSWAELSFHGSRLMLQKIGLLADHLPGIARQLTEPSHALVLRVGSIGDTEALYGRLDDLGMGAQTGLRRTHYGTMEFSIVDPDGYVLLIAGYAE
ncbi:MAG TPA: VOC family protein [Streptosporangiaceae bacterium]|nr:VOC family protein [Streptosporangiaceae bacterium]